MRYIHVFTVKGDGHFPVDMLRYDACYPKGQGDVVLAFMSRPQERSVTMAHAGPKTWKPTAARWQSFGWTVSDHRSVKI